MSTEPGVGQELSSQRALGVYQIMPSQYFDMTGGSSGLSGEQRLMAALLADAINVFRKGAFSRRARQRLLYIDAERWMAGQGPTSHAFTFETVCDALGIDAALVRRKMIEWKHSMRNESARSTPQLRLKLTPRRQRVSAGRSRAHRRRRMA